MRPKANTTITKSCSFVPGTWWCGDIRPRHLDLPCHSRVGLTAETCTFLLDSVLLLSLVDVPHSATQMSWGLHCIFGFKYYPLEDLRKVSRPWTDIAYFICPSFTIWMKVSTIVCLLHSPWLINQHMPMLASSCSSSQALFHMHWLLSIQMDKYWSEYRINNPNFSVLKNCSRDSYFSRESSENLSVSYLWTHHG